MKMFTPGKMAIWTGLTCLIATAVLAGGLSNGTKAPDIVLNDINGKTFKLADYKGKVVFVNFWATWCPPCREEFPEIVKMHESYAKNGNVKIVSLSIDSAKTINRVKPFAQQNKAKHQILLGAKSADIANAYNIEYIPTNVLIGKDGKIIQTWESFSGEEDVKKWKAAIDKALK